MRKIETKGNNVNIEILDFIWRRFSKDCDWTDGNRYYFVLILKDRFPGGRIYYNLHNGHFCYLFMGKFYDWTGEIDPDGRLVAWDSLKDHDSERWNRTYRDFLM